MTQFWKSKTVRTLGTVCLALFGFVIVLFLSEGYVKQQVPAGPYGLHVFVDLWNKGYVGLEGTWVIENEKSAFPLQISSITCRAEEKKCTESRAQVSGSTLMVSQDSYEITQWNEHILIYTTTFAKCVDYVYTVSRDTKQVSGLRKLKVGMEKECPDTSKELRLRLTNGFDVYLEMQKESRPVAASVAVLIGILLWAGFHIRKIIKTQVPTL